MVRKARYVWEMRSVIPATQGSVGNFLIRIAQVAADCAKSYLKSLARDQLAPNFEEEVTTVKGIVINNLKSLYLRGSSEDGFKKWKHSASPLPLPANGRGTAPQPAILLNHLPPERSAAVCPDRPRRKSGRNPGRDEQPVWQIVLQRSGKRIGSARPVPDIASPVSERSRPPASSTPHPHSCKSRGQERGQQSSSPRQAHSCIAIYHDSQPAAIKLPSDLALSRHRFLSPATAAPLDKTPGPPQISLTPRFLQP